MGFLGTLPECDYNSGCACRFAGHTKRDAPVPKACLKCGWYPPEAKRRRIRYKLGLDG